MFAEHSSRHWPLVLTPRALLWVEAHVTRLEMSGYVSEAAAAGALSALRRWCRALEVAQFRQDWCVVETMVESRDHRELRPPSPERLSLRRTMREQLVQDVRQLGVRASNASPAFHIRSALAKLNGRMMTMEEYIDWQVLESPDSASVLIRHGEFY